MSARMTGEALFACSSGHPDPAERAALGALVNAVRRDAPSVDVRDTPMELMVPEDEWPPVRVAVPLALTDGTDVSAALAIARRSDPGLVVAHALGPDWSLAEICVQRLIEAGARKDDTIVLGVAGSQDESAIEGYSRRFTRISGQPDTERGKFPWRCAGLPQGVRTQSARWVALRV